MVRTKKRTAAGKPVAKPRLPLRTPATKPTESTLPWLDKKDPAAKLCRDADKAGLTPRAYADLRKSKIDAGDIEKAEGLDRQWRAHAEIRIAEINKKRAMHNRLLAVVDRSYYGQPVSATVIAVEASIKLSGIQTWLAARVKEKRLVPAVGSNGHKYVAGSAARRRPSGT